MKPKRAIFLEAKILHAEFTGGSRWVAIFNPPREIERSLSEVSIRSPLVGISAVVASPSGFLGNSPEHIGVMDFSRHHWCRTTGCSEPGLVLCRSEAGFAFTDYFFHGVAGFIRPVADPER